MGKLRVLMYHKIVADEASTDFLSVSEDMFRKQMEWVKDKYVPISLSDITEHIKTGKILPENAILISFDDGYLNNYELAYPILKSMQIPFCVFPVADFIGQTLEYDGTMQSFMSREQLIEMQDLAEYGYHGMQHLNLNDLDLTQKKAEIQKAVTEFKDQGIPMQNAWAYTYGAYPKKDKSAMDELKQIFSENGIICAFRIGNRLNNSALKHQFEIQRLDIRGDESFCKFRLRLLFGKFF